MKRGRSGHLVRTIILLAAVVAAFIVVSAALRYNRESGLFDSHEQRPVKAGQPLGSKIEKSAE